MYVTFVTHLIIAAQKESYDQNQSSELKYVIRHIRINHNNAVIILFEPWRPKGYFQFE